MDNIRAMVLLTIGMGLFASCDAMIKLATRFLPSGVILVVVSVFIALIFLAICLRQKTTVWSRLYLHPIVVLRNAAEVVGSSSLFLAFAIAPLSTIAAIMQASPLVLTLGAAIILKENVGPRRWTAVCLGLVGVLIILRPIPGDFEASSLLAVIGTVAMAFRDLASRMAPPEATTPQLSLYAFVSLIPAGIVLAYFEGKPSSWPAEVYAYLAGAVVFGFAAYFLVTIAMRIGEVSAVSPLRYTRLPFAAIWGYAVFSEVPDIWTIAGAVLVITSGLYVMMREAQLHKRSAP